MINKASDLYGPLRVLWNDNPCIRDIDVIAIGSFLRREMGSSLLTVRILAGVEAEIQRHSALRAKA